MKNIKLTFLLLIAFYFSFHFVIPAVCYWKLGYVSTYNANVLDFQSMRIGFLLNFTSLFVGGIAIAVTPTKKIVPPVWKEKNSLIFLLLSLFFTVGVFLTNLDFFDSLKTSLTRHDYWVFGEMFFNLDFYILFAMTYSFNFISESQLFYVFIKILSAARSAPLVLFHYGMCSIASPVAIKYRKKIIVYLVISFAFSIFGFNWATKIRNEKITGEIVTNQPMGHRLSQTVTVSHQLFYQILGRISYLENAMLPIHFKDDPKRSEIFKNKYSFKRQMELFINNIVPGDIFEFDVYPNQYYRAAFMNMSVAQAKEFYTSVNLTLPVYFYMYSNFVVSCLASSVVIWIYFVVTSAFFKLHPLLGMGWLATFYPGLLTFFDFVMIGKALVLIAISTGLFLVLARINLRAILGRWGRVED
ncbi:MAG: hypothetical protein H7336_06070 [Bacteriovorax sp.]|nr:hypothetical protein [Bacteriovorax sp.]